MLFSRSERKGVIILSFLVIGLIILPRQFRAKESDLFLLPEMDDVAEYPLVSSQDSGNRGVRAVSLKQRKTKKMLSLELNRADSSQLLRVKGIGPYYAGKILRYRKRLGGFHSVEQLKEIPMAYLDVDSVLPFFTVNPELIEKQELDTMSFKGILRHPYLEYEDVQFIFNAKRQYGGISYALLEEKKILPAKILKKIKPYFK